MVNIISANTTYFTIIVIGVIIAILLLLRNQAKEAIAAEEKEIKLLKEWSASSEVKKEQNKTLIETRLKIPKDWAFTLQIEDRFIADRGYREELTNITAVNEDNDWQYLTLETEVNPSERLLAIAKIYKGEFDDPYRDLKGTKTQEIDT